MTFTAKLTGNRRDISTGSPKALLTHIEPNEQLPRDHCWVDITETIADIQPAGHKKPIKVSFEADTKPYLKQGTIEAITLHNIRNIKRIK